MKKLEAERLIEALETQISRILELPYSKELSALIDFAINKSRF